MRLEVQQGTLIESDKRSIAILSWCSIRSYMASDDYFLVTDHDVLPFLSALVWFSFKYIVFFGFLSIFYR